MDAFIGFFQHHFPFIIGHKYLFIFIGTVLEGMNSIILAGFLASVGFVAFWPMFFICLFGEALNGYMWYIVGYFAGAKPIDKWGRKDEKSRRIIETVERYFHQYSGRAIVFAKLTWSLTIATEVMAGSFKYDLRKYTLYNLLGGIGWVAITFFIGYLFGRGYQALFIINHIGYLMLFLASAVILIYVLRHFFRSKFFRSLAARERLRELGDRVRDGLDKFLSE